MDDLLKKKLLKENQLLKNALYAADLSSLMETLRNESKIESIVEYDVNDEGIQLQEEWGKKTVSDYQKRIKIDPEKEYNRPLLDVIQNKKPYFIEKGSKFLKREDQGSIFLIPKLVKGFVRRIYKVQSSEENELINTDNTEFFSSLILAVVRKKEELQQREAIIEIVQNITAKMTLNERLKEIVKIVDSLSFIDKCAIKLMEDGFLVVKAVSNNFGNYIENATSIELQKEMTNDEMSIGAKAFFSRRTVYERQLDKKKSKAAAMGLTSMLSVPLINEHQEAFGVLNVFTEWEHEFSKEELAIIEKYAKLAAVTIINAHNYEEKVAMNHQLLQALTEKELVLADLNNTQEKLLKAEKLAVLGEIAVSVNHEINNPLTAIMLSAQVLKSYKCDKDLVLNDEIQNRTNTIIEYIYKIQKIVNLLNNASRSEHIISKEYVTGTNMIDLEKMSGLVER